MNRVYLAEVFGPRGFSRGYASHRGYRRPYATRLTHSSLAMHLPLYKTVVRPLVKRRGRTATDKPVRPLSLVIRLARMELYLTARPLYLDALGLLHLRGTLYGDLQDPVLVASVDLALIHPF